MDVTHNTEKDICAAALNMSEGDEIEVEDEQGRVFQGKVVETGVTEDNHILRVLLEIDGNEEAEIRILIDPEGGPATTQLRIPPSTVWAHVTEIRAETRYTA